MLSGLVKYLCVRRLENKTQIILKKGEYNQSTKLP